MESDSSICSPDTFAEESSCLLQRSPRSFEVADAGIIKGRTEKVRFPNAMANRTSGANGTISKISKILVIRNLYGRETATIDISGRSRDLADNSNGVEENIGMAAVNKTNKKERRSDYDGSIVNNALEDALSEDDLESNDRMRAQGLNDFGDDSEDDKVERQASTIIAVMLLAMVGMVMSVFYLANYPEEDLQDVTWTLLESTLGLFCAVLIFTVVKDTMQKLNSLDDKSHLEVLVTNLVRLVAVLIVSRWATSKAWASVGANLSGFAAVETFGRLQRYAFAQSWEHGMATVFGTAIGLLVASFAFTQVVRAIVSQPSQNFTQACKYSGVDSAGLTLGLVVALTVHHAINGAAPLVGQGETIEPSATESEFHRSSVAAFIGLLMVASNFWMNHAREGTRVERIARSTQGILSMALGWCLLSWGQWLSWLSDASQQPVVLPAIIAVVLSGLILTTVFLLDCLALEDFAEPIGAKALIATVAVLLGLAWENVCLLAVEGISGWLVGASVRLTLMDAGQTVLLWGWCCQLGYCVSYFNDSYV